MKTILSHKLNGSQSLRKQVYWLLLIIIISFNLLFLAYKEAQEIQEKQNFGSHAKFDTWESTVENKYFTEFSVIVDAK